MMFRLPQRSRRPPGPVLLAILPAVLLATAPAAAELPAFPGAEGYGSTTPGGRGGRVVHVTSLADSGPGSLREALAIPEPRTILFAVAGVIRLETPLYLGGTPSVDDGDAYSFVTLAGESAPGGGVLIADQDFVLTNQVHDVVIRHLRFRNSIRDKDGTRSLGDGIDFRGAHRVVVDHCSFSWATDENVSLEIAPGGNREITLQRNLVAEGLWNGGHEEGDHSRGIQVAKGADQVSVHHNFLMSNDFRNPQTAGNGLGEYDGALFPTFDVRYNLTYNSGRKDAHTKLGARVNWIGNLFVKGPDSRVTKKPMEVQEPFVDTRIYLEGNYSPDFPDATQVELVEFRTGEVEGVQDQPFATPAVTPTALDELDYEVLRGVGARPLDPTDVRLIGEYLDGKGSLGAPERTHASPIPDPAPGTPPADGDLDGLPDDWESDRGLDPDDPADGAADRDGDGYTNLEEYLHERAAERVCELPDLRLVVPAQTLSGERRFAACHTLEVEPGVVVAQGASVTFSSGGRIVVADGLEIGENSDVTFEIDPTP